MKIMLNATEGRKVLDALVDVAVSNGWNEDELEESGVIEEYTTAVDAAMQAMGLELVINPDDCDDDDDDDDFEEDEEDYELTEDAYFNYDDDDDDEEEDYELTEDDKILAQFMFAMVQKNAPNLPFELQADLAATLCVKWKKENEEE